MAEKEITEAEKNKLMHEAIGATLEFIKKIKADAEEIIEFQKNRGLPDPDQEIV